MSDIANILEQLREHRAQLEAAAEPLRAQLARCDETISLADKAQQHRDALLRQHDQLIADAIADNRDAGPPDPRLDDAEVDLRRAKSNERGALVLREGVQADLAEINQQLSIVAAELDQTIWQSVPAASHHLLVACEAARLAYEATLAAVDSVAAYAHEVAHQGGNGVLAESTPAFGCYQTVRAMIATETAALGSNATRNFKVGKSLVDSVAAGRAVFGDVSRWLPSFRGAIDGTKNLNRPQASAEPVERDRPDLGIAAPPEVDLPLHAAAP